MALLGAGFLIGGFVAYVRIAPQWQQDQSLLLRVAAALSPHLRQQIATTRTEYFGSIGAMILGGFLALAGLLGQIRRGN